MALMRHLRIRGNELKYSKKLIMISLRDQGSENADALFGD